MNWGLSLVFAFVSSLSNIPTKLTKGVDGSNWDEDSRLMLGEILTELNLPVKDMNTTHECKLETINNCDICIIQRHKMSNILKQYLKHTKAKNIPIIDVNIWL